MIIPPPVKTIKWVDPKNSVAGVIGSVDKNKQTHVSIQKALKDGFSKVKLFGEVTDPQYFSEKVKPLVDGERVTLESHEDDQEALYAQISTVYHSSLSETYGLVEAECRLAGIPFVGESNGQDVVKNEEILERWKILLDQ
jgi:hypothetical protein